jgi:hypothetical protein
LAAAGITYDFGASNIKKARIGSMENYARYFPKGYDRAPGVESVPKPVLMKALYLKIFYCWASYAAPPSSRGHPL